MATHFSPDHWVAVIKRGKVIFELGGISENLAREAMHFASYKLPIATSFITKGEMKVEG
jgi:large subunit ribosomal protein L16